MILNNYPAYQKQIYFRNNKINNKEENFSPKTPIKKETIMLTAISASGVGRVLGLDIGKDIAAEWVKKKAEKLVKDDKEEQKLMAEKLLKKFKFPITLTSTTVGVLTGLFAVLIPAKIYNDKIKRNNG